MALPAGAPRKERAYLVFPRGLRAPRLQRARVHQSAVVRVEYVAIQQCTSPILSFIYRNTVDTTRACSIWLILRMDECIPRLLIQLGNAQIRLVVL